jgi:hypothetical protein
MIRRLSVDTSQKKFSPRRAHCPARLARAGLLSIQTVNVAEQQGARAHKGY